MEVRVGSFDGGHTSCDVWRPGDPVPDGYRISTADGLPARFQGPWARDKLRFFDEFQRPALGATKKKAGQTHYVDLYAGPGRNVSDGEGEYPGSPIRALNARFEGKGWEGTFGRYHFCNLDRFDYGLLEARINHQLETTGSDSRRSQIRHYHQDANEAIRTIMESIPQWAYVLAFADIEGPGDIAFDTLRELRRRHDSVDLYILFPTNIGSARVLPFDPTLQERHAPMWTRYFGSEEWRPIMTRLRTSNDRGRLMAELRNLYIRQLETIWKKADTALHVRKDGTKKYDMILASDFDAVWSMSRSARNRTIPLDMFDGTEYGPGMSRSN